MDGPVNVQVGTLSDGRWYVRHMGFGTRAFDGKQAAWDAARGLMGRHEGRWESVAADSAPFLAVCRADGSRVLYDINDDACLYGCWGDQRDRLWDAHLAAISAGTTLRSTETHKIFGGYIEVVAYDDPLDGVRRHAVVTARDPGSDYRAVDHLDRAAAEVEYEETVYANWDMDFPYKATDIFDIQVDRKSKRSGDVAMLDDGTILDKGDLDEYNRLYGLPPRMEWPKTPGPSVPLGPVGAMTAGPRDWAPSVDVEDMTPAAWTLADPELRANALSLAALPDGRRLLASAHDDGAHVWSIGGGEGVQRVSGHSEWVLSVALTVLGDGRAVLATGGKDGLARAWSVREGEALQEIEAHDGPVNSVAWACPPGEVPWLVTGGDDAAVRLWDPGTKLPLGAFEVGEPRVHLVWSVAAAALSDGHVCVAAAVDDFDGAAVHVWDATAKAKLHEFRVETGGALSRMPEVAVTTLADHSFRVAAVAGRTLHVWDGHTGRAVRTLQVSEDGDSGVALAALPDLRAVVAATSGRETLAWDVESGAVLARVEHAAGGLPQTVDLVAGQDGGLLLAAGRGGDAPARVLRLDPAR
ncbi:WD40 repeat domain-containing protein [Actinomadura graeca]|uniref:WD40 repeat domain-containing protein n=2 Tax=Actinomadura graeca TaxID=2750812 RepID=A0ABX8R6R2_9ACTN|nr:WD40 repeat domain-containing protein [Actinomadura graeca]